MNGLEHEDDLRNTAPDASGHRRARFRQGWADAAGGLEYSPQTLGSLTWQNLGYRLGKVLGRTSVELIDAFYDLCVRQQAESTSVE